MTTNRDVIADMVSAMNAGDMDRFLSHYSDDVTITIMSTGQTMTGSGALRTWIEEAFDSLDGFSNDVLGIYGEGDAIALEVIARGTVNREFFGRRPGEPFDAAEVYVYELSDRKISEVRVYL